MNYRLPIILSFVVILACSQIDAPREDPEGGSAESSLKRNQSDQKAVSATQSTRQEYRKTYNMFKVHHRNVFDLINENKLALRNEGRKSVQAAKDLLNMLSDANQSELQDVFNNYQQAWEGFDQRTPSVGERNRLKSAGKNIRREFQPDKVQLKAPDAAQPSQTADQSKEKSGAEIVREESSRNISVKNPSRYRELFEQWQRAHKRFQVGLENDDPLLKSTFQELTSAIEAMIAQVDSSKDKLKNYYLSQYQLIFSSREQFSGTPAKSDHLTYLKRQFKRDFALTSE